MHTLKVKTSEAAMVPDYDAFASGVMRFIGRTHDPKVGPCGAWVCNGQVCDVPASAEYRQEVHGGALIPQDEHTAKVCGVPWVPPAVD